MRAGTGISPSFDLPLLGVVRPVSDLRRKDMTTGRERRVRSVSEVVRLPSSLQTLDLHHTYRRVSYGSPS